MIVVGWFQLAAKLQSSCLLTAQSPTAVEWGKNYEEQEHESSSVETGKLPTNYHCGQNRPNFGEFNLIYCQLM